MTDFNDDEFAQACLQFFDAVGLLSFSMEQAKKYFGSVSSGVAWELRQDIWQYGGFLLNGFRHRLTDEEAEQLQWFVSNLEKDKRDLIKIESLYQSDQSLCKPWEKVKADSLVLTITFRTRIVGLIEHFKLSSQWGARLGV
jgi:hypothetical protein